MKPYYFNNEDKSLLGIYHSPTSVAWREEGIVICYPIFNDYVRSYPAFIQLTDALTKLGFPVFRFDYYGTGDSYGDSQEADFTVWQNDIALAVKELKQAAGIQQVSLITTRLSSAFTTDVNQEIGKFKRIVMWDPVLDGDSYINELNQAYCKEASLKETELSKDVLLGQRISMDLRDQIENIALQKTTRFSSNNIFIITGQSSPAYADFHQDLLDQHIQSHIENIPSNYDWSDIEGPMVIPTEIINKIANYFKNSA